MEDLKKKFIVDEKVYEKEKIPEQINRILKYCKITKEGIVIIEKNSFTLKENIALILIARFLANKLDENIPSEMGIEEIVASMKTNNRDSLITRTKELVDDNLAKRTSKGRHQIVPFYVDSILDKLDKKEKE